MAKKSKKNIDGIVVKSGEVGTGLKNIEITALVSMMRDCRDRLNDTQVDLGVELYAALDDAVRAAAKLAQHQGAGLNIRVHRTMRSANVSLHATS